MTEFTPMRRIRQQQSKEMCEQILREEKRGVFSIIDENGYPYGVPINFYYEDGVIYFHGAKNGKKIEAIKKNPNVSFTVYNQGYQEPGDWVYNVTSVIAFGQVRMIEDYEECVTVCRKLGEKYYPPEKSIQEEIDKSIAYTLCLAIDIEYMTGKLVNES